jgi:glycosyltransferase involved in cell wall biosynthesis
MLYRAANVSIVPLVSLEGFGFPTLEGFGFPTIEPLPCGRPVLVTPVGGLPEVVEGLCRDFVLPGHEAAALADGLIAFLEGRLRLPDEASCAAFAAERYDWAVIGPRVARVYSDMLGGVTQRSMPVH